MTGMPGMEVAIPPEASERQLLVSVLSRVMVLQAVQTRMEAAMTQAFDDLRTAAQNLGGEGGQLTQAKDAILAAIQSLQSINATLQTNNAALQQAANDANAALAAGEQVASETTATINGVIDTANTVEAQLQAAADALNTPPPAP